jgi:hypothetical protein
MKSYHVGVAAEACAALLFAQAEYEVLVQYGANQPGYDLVVARDTMSAKISVKGSQDGGWVLIASYKRDRTYHEAIDAWAAAHADPEILYCFVQLKGVAFGQMPRIYLARLPEVVAYLKASCGGHGYTSLREAHKWARGKAGGTTDTIPPSWTMTKESITMLLGPAVATQQLIQPDHP